MVLLIFDRFKPACFLLLCTCTLLLAGCSDYMLKTPSEFGESAYIALKNNDESGFRTLFIDESDGDYIYATFSNHHEINREDFDKDMREDLAEMESSFHSRFSRMREKGVEMGINWEHVEFKGVDVSTEKEKNGFRVVDVRTFFTSNTLDFTLSFEEVAKLDQTFTAGDFPSLDPYRP